MSCCTALLKITEDWREALDERQTVSAVSIDLSKAFDTICHCLLIRKLAAYGLQDHSIQLIRSYLINRKQRVKIENAYSNWRVVQCGVPQGSPLGPLLFNIYINDITRITKNMELRLYADDTTGYAASNSPATLEFYINSDLARLSHWLEDNYLSINATKTQAMIVGKSNYNYELTLKSNNILTIDELKLLGVTIDNNLTFSSHIKLVLSKIHAKIAALRRIRNFIDSDTAVKLYKSYILPHFDYCSPLLIGINQTLSDKLENANYYVLRTLFNLPKSISYKQILLQYNLDSIIKHRRMVQALTLVYKSYPNYISNMFRTKNCVYNLRGNGSRLDQPAPNTGFKHRSFSYIACRLWNKIPLHVREDPNLKNFMAKLKQLKLSQDECRCNFCSN